MLTMAILTVAIPSMVMLTVAVLPVALLPRCASSSPRTSCATCSPNMATARPCLPPRPTSSLRRSSPAGCPTCCALAAVARSTRGQAGSTLRSPSRSTHVPPHPPTHRHHLPRFRPARPPAQRTRLASLPLPPPRARVRRPALTPDPSPIPPTTTPSPPLPRPRRVRRVRPPPPPPLPPRPPPLALPTR